ncbi:hypothetical protein HZA56_21930 [Candidatus Poribacteria bacterium]|nr:hypothetical protein [Candidatus Poribacteria bacterium]
MAASRTYTTSADFDEGVLTGVNHDPPNGDQLRLDTTLSTFPFIWVANSGAGTVSKLDTRTGRELGRYRTGPSTSTDPSRTSVDLAGNVWLGNRGPGNTAVKIGLLEANNCVDRNGNGTIETSTDVNNNGIIDAGEILCWQCDECLLNYVTVGAGNPRAVAVDANNDVWIGGGVTGGNRYIQLLDGETGVIMRTINIGALVGAWAYGALVDGNGILWVSTHESAGGSVLRIDPSLPDGDPNLVRVIPLATGLVYGIGIDSNGNVFASGWTYRRLAKIAPNGTVLFDIYISDSRYYQSRGVAVTADGDVWVANTSSSYVTRHDNATGAVKAYIYLGAAGGRSPTGVAVDADGRVWVPCLDTDNVAVIDPATNTVIGMYRVGDYPYNYSDMTGMIARTQTRPSGDWNVVYDGGEEGLEWGSVSWNSEPEGNEPAGTDITVEVRAADTQAGLGGQPYFEALSGGPIPGVTGRYIQARCTLELTSPGAAASPVLSDLKIETAGCQSISPVYVEYRGVTYDRITKIMSGNCTIRNDTTGTLIPEVRLIVESISSDPSVTVANADGVTDDGKPYFDFSALLGADNELGPGETTGIKVIRFNNPNQVRFRWTYSVCAYVE